MPLRRWLAPALLSLSLATPTAALAQQPAEPTPAEPPADEFGPEPMPEPAQPSAPPAAVAPAQDQGPATIQPVLEPVTPAPAKDTTNAKQSAKQALDPARPGAEPVNASDALRSLESDDRTFRSGRWSYRFGGYIRSTYTAVANDPQSPLFGRNDGFLVANARPYILGALDNGLGFSLQMELAAGLDRPSSGLPNQEVLVRPRDAYIFYAPFKLLEIQLGSFRPPHDAESLLPTNNMLFIRRSVGVEGVSPAEGYQTTGLGYDREVGLQVTGTHFFASPDQSPQGPGIQYAVAVTNGTPASRTLNDNDSPALWARAAFLWGDYVRLGAAFLYNDATLGEPPDLVGERRSAWTADLLLRFAGATVFGSYTSRTASTDFGQDTSGGEDPYTTANALQVQAGYLIPVVNLQPVYRFATFDPTADYNIDAAGDFREADALTQHTFGLNYIWPDSPVTIMLDYTVTQEQAGRELDNNRLEALVQLTW